MITEKQIIKELEKREENIDGGETLGVHCINYGNVARGILKLITDESAPEKVSVQGDGELDIDYYNIMLKYFPDGIEGSSLPNYRSRALGMITEILSTPPTSGSREDKAKISVKVIN